MRLLRQKLGFDSIQSDRNKVQTNVARKSRDNTSVPARLFLAFAHVGPQCLHLRRLEHAAPSGHGVDTLADGRDKPIMLVVGEMPQVKGADLSVRVFHVLSMADGAVTRIER